MDAVPEPKARWLLLIHQLPPTPAYLRVKTARQLQKIGAVAIKNSVYVLPSSDTAYESFTWVAREIAAQHGESSLCESNFVGGSSNEAIEALFNAARGKDYQELAVELRAALKGQGKDRRLSEERRAAGRTALARLRRRHAEIHALDFFGAPQAQSVASLLDDLETRLRQPTAAAAKGVRPAAEKIRRGTWVTRQGVHVDRIASAWLIRRFIDSEATFKFVPARGYQPEPGERRFDMFEAEYTHEGDRCTFEVLARRFAVDDPAVQALAEVVHDIDVRDGKFARPETPGIERMVNGLALTQTDDDARIAGGSLLFDALYASFKRKRR